MKMLFISAWFPYPPDNGARVRAYNLIKALSRRHEVFLISLMQEDSRAENARHLDGLCEVVSLHPSRWFRPGTVRSTLGYLSRRPRSVVDTFEPSVARAVREAAARIRPDTIVASSIGAAEYVPHDLGIPTVLEQHNCEYAVLKRKANLAGGLRGKIGWKKFARWEASVCRKFSTVTVVSKEDRRLLAMAAPDLVDLPVIPNGVDTEHFAFRENVSSGRYLIYNGALTYGANLDAVRWFASDIYPLLNEARAGIKLRVTGRADGADLSGVIDCPGIELTGYVADIRGLLAQSAACVVPLRQGGGSRLKILEAMAAGVPVVSTSVGAEGIDVSEGEHLLIADSPKDFASAIDRLLSDPRLAQGLAKRARQLVEEQYSWREIGEAFVRVVEDAVQTYIC